MAAAFPGRSASGHGPRQYRYCCVWR